MPNLRDNIDIFVQKAKDEGYNVYRNSFSIFYPNKKKSPNIKIKEKGTLFLLDKDNIHILTDSGKTNRELVLLTDYFTLTYNEARNKFELYVAGRTDNILNKLKQDGYTYRFVLDGNSEVILLTSKVRAYVVGCNGKTKQIEHSNDIGNYGLMQDGMMYKVFKNGKLVAVFDNNLNTLLK